MPEKPPLHPEEVRRILRELAPLSEDRRIVLVGGQAVAFWAAFFKLKPRSAEQEIFTSKDIDFLVAPYGLDGRDVRDTAVKLAVTNPTGPDLPVWVMHPERCMESRIYNVVDLRQRGRIGLDQLRRSVVCAKEFSRFLLGEDGVAEAERVRAVLRLNERIYRKCLKDRACRQVVFDHDVDPFEAVLVDDRLPERFREKRYPQMVEQIADRRRRSRAQRERVKRRKAPK